MEKSREMASDRSDGKGWVMRRDGAESEWDSITITKKGSAEDITVRYR